MVYADSSTTVMIQHLHFLQNQQHNNFKFMTNVAIQTWDRKFIWFKVRSMLSSASFWSVNFTTWSTEWPAYLNKLDWHKSFSSVSSKALLNFLIFNLNFKCSQQIVQGYARSNITISSITRKSWMSLNFCTWPKGVTSSQLL